MATSPLWTSPQPCPTRVRTHIKFLAHLARPRFWTLFGLLLGLGLIPWGTAGSSAAAADLNPEQVRRSIELAVKYLRREQNDDGTWPQWRSHDLTALCTLALLHAGVEAHDPAIQKALAHLRTEPPASTYVTSLQTMVFCAADPKADLLLIRRNAQWFAATQIKNGSTRGMWSYPGSKGDQSNTQFALLGMYEAERALERYGQKSPIPLETWRLALSSWETSQNGDGSWGYQPSTPGTGSMTCAGIASVVIASGRLQTGDASVVGDHVRCCNEQRDDSTIARGLAWLGRNFSVHANPGNKGGMWWLYYLYGVERVGRLTGQRFIGGRDWYREGTEVLVAQQDPLSGFWKGTGTVEDNELIATSFSLLFLVKGRRPVLMSRMSFAGLSMSDWNAHRAGVPNMTHYVENKWRRDLTWQTIDTSRATVDDLLQSPVLLLSSKHAPQFSKEQVQTLRDYIDRGGFLLAESCCTDGRYDAQFQVLMQRVFPEKEFSLRQLEPDHEVWMFEENPGDFYAGELYGVNVGCRTAVIYSRKPMTCYWELADAGRGEALPAAVAPQIESALAMGINILAYATNRELKNKYEIPSRVVQDAPESSIDRAKLYIRKLRHGGGWNAAPGALVNLQRALNEETGIATNTDDLALDINDPQIFDHHLLFMHGRNSFTLTTAQRQQLATFLKRGGMILADAVCASEAFAESFRKEMKLILPDDKLEPIPADHDMFSSTFGGFDLISNKVNRREPAARGSGPLRANLREVSPQLEGVSLDGHYAVIFSPFDLSCALESHEGVDCRGYTRDDAARIGINAVLYSLHE